MEGIDCSALEGLIDELVRRPGDALAVLGPWQPSRGRDDEAAQPPVTTVPERGEEHE